MTWLVFPFESFKSRVLDGLTSAYSRYIERVPDASGVMRVGGPVPGKVAVVIGGGSGHYPAFAGLVGPGLADAAVMGDVFTSPSAEQAYRVARAMDGGAGIVFSYGNYAGDVLNFGAAEQRLCGEGIDCRTVLVTDDVASATVEEIEKRRGIAGDLVVFKAAGAAAERGDDLDNVERLACKANAATRTLGIAFGACTLPGQSEPLFTVEPGTYEIGMGIHGEPGVRTVEAQPVDEIASTLVESLASEATSWASDRVAVVLNGLGRAKYEELFVLWREVAPLITAAGLEIVLPEVGEFVTSLDMAGCSLTVTWLDEELEELWRAPCETAAFRRVGERGGRGSQTAGATKAASSAEGRGEARSLVDDDSAKAASTARAILVAMREAVHDHEDKLGRLDAVAGDGDHGSGMSRGLAAAVEAASTSTGLGSTLRSAGRAFADRAGGTSGLLWGVFLESLAESFGDASAPTAKAVAAAVRTATHEVKRVGGAEIGDKTLIDALQPFADSLSEGVAAGQSLVDAWSYASVVASEAAQSTASLIPRIGRARPLAQRSIGTVDPGAASLSLCINAAKEVLQAEKSESLD
jgi:dihydroxyacetone kinase